MISFLTGKIHNKTSDSLTLLVNGVGYLVFVPPSTLLKVSVGEDLELYVHTHVRDDALDLYGFAGAEDLSLFKLLISVSGVGPKTALAVIDRGVQAVKQAIIEADQNFFTLVPRLGKKNAQKIIIELKSKLGGVAELDLQDKGGHVSLLVEALLSMGYTQVEAVNAARAVPPDIKTVEEQIRLVLRQMGKEK